MKKKRRPAVSSPKVSSSFELLADIRSLSKIRSAIEAQARTLKIQRRRIYRVLLAVEEAASNVIRHAYDSGRFKPLYIEIEVTRKEVKVTIRDVGKPFDFRNFPSKSLVHVALRKRARGGYGVHLIKSLVDKYEYVRSENGENHLQLTKKI